MRGFYKKTFSFETAAGGLSASGVLIVFAGATIGLWMGIKKGVAQASHSNPSLFILLVTQE